MTPREAGQVEYEEPDWKLEFEYQTGEILKVHPHWTIDLAQDEAYERILSRWRRFHSTPIIHEGEHKRQPVGMTEGVIALAKLKIMPPRNTIKDVPRDGKCYSGDQSDAHCWLIISGRAWRIVGIEDKTLVLDSFGEGKQIDLPKARWDKYVEAAVEFLNAQPSITKT